MADKQAPQDPTAGVREPTVAVVPGTGFFELGALAKVADLTIKCGEKIVEWIKSEWPLFLQILDSRIDEGHYSLKFKATNLTPHGVYIESCTLTAPLKREKLISLPRSNISFANDSKDPVISGEQTLISPGGDKIFNITLSSDDTNYLQSGALEGNRNIGSAIVNYRLLNEESEGQKTINFALRLK